MSLYLTYTRFFQVLHKSFAFQFNVFSKEHNPFYHSSSKTLYSPMKTTFPSIIKETCLPYLFPYTTYPRTYIKNIYWVKLNVKNSAGFSTFIDFNLSLHFFWTKKRLIRQQYCFIGRRYIILKTLPFRSKTTTSISTRLLVI
jgi:hypothetical protein